MRSEARKLVWSGAIPLQVQLHHSEVTTLPHPPPFLLLAPRNSYFPLLIPLVKPQFQNALPIGQDTGWFEYRGLPLKWHLPIGVLFDLLCLEPERPWSLLVHFRGYPSELLPCDGEDTLKWSFMNSLKEASYLRFGSTKNVMNLSQADQADLWKFVMQGDLEHYDRVCSKLTPSNCSSTTRMPPVRLSFRLYVRIMTHGVDMQEVPVLEKWDNILYITRPVDVCRDDGSVLTLWDGLVKIAPQLFTTCSEVLAKDGKGLPALIWDREPSEPSTTGKSPLLPRTQPIFSNGALRIQGIEPSPDLPLNWVGQNLSGPDQSIHVCLIIVSAEKRT